MQRLVEACRLTTSATPRGDPIFTPHVCTALRLWHAQRPSAAALRGHLADAVAAPLQTPKVAIPCDSNSAEGGKRQHAAREVLRCRRVVSQLAPQECCNATLPPKTLGEGSLAESADEGPPHSKGLPKFCMTFESVLRCHRDDTKIGSASRPLHSIHASSMKVCSEGSKAMGLQNSWRLPAAPRTRADRTCREQGAPGA